MHGGIRFGENQNDQEEFSTLKNRLVTPAMAHIIPSITLRKKSCAKRRSLPAPAETKAKVAPLNRADFIVCKKYCTDCNCHWNVEKYVEALDENMQFSRYTETIITADDMQERMKPDP